MFVCVEEKIKTLSQNLLTGYSILFFYYGSQWCQSTVWLIQKISSFVFSRRKWFFGWSIPL